jgi:pimeloyl-ACP methyl ester carboxylesterase
VLLARVPGVLNAIAQTMRIRALRRTPLMYGSVMRHHPQAAISDSYVVPGLHPEIRRDTRKVLLGMSKAHTLEAAERFHRFEAPVLVAWAGQDRVFPHKLATRLAAAFPRAELATIEGSRTFVAEDQPGELARLIANFQHGEPAPRQTQP